MFFNDNLMQQQNSINNFINLNNKTDNNKENIYAETEQYINTLNEDLKYKYKYKSDTDFKKNPDKKLDKLDALAQIAFAKIYNMVDIDRYLRECLSKNYRKMINPLISHLKSLYSKFKIDKRTDGFGMKHLVKGAEHPIYLEIKNKYNVSYDWAVTIFDKYIRILHFYYCLITYSPIVLKEKLNLVKFLTKDNIKNEQIIITTRLDNNNSLNPDEKNFMNKMYNKIFEEMHQKNLNYMFTVLKGKNIKNSLININNINNNLSNLNNITTINNFTDINQNNDKIINQLQKNLNSYNINMQISNKYEYVSSAISSLINSNLKNSNYKIANELMEIYQNEYKKIKKKYYMKIYYLSEDYFYYLCLIEMRTLYAYFYLILNNSDLANKIDLHSSLKYNKDNILNVVFQINDYTKYQNLQYYEKNKFNKIFKSITTDIDKNIINNIAEIVMNSKKYNKNNNFSNVNSSINSNINLKIDD